MHPTKFYGGPLHGSERVLEDRFRSNNLIVTRPSEENPGDLHTEMGTYVINRTKAVALWCGWDSEPCTNPETIGTSNQIPILTQESNLNVLVDALAPALVFTLKDLAEAIKKTGKELVPETIRVTVEDGEIRASVYVVTL